MKSNSLHVVPQAGFPTKYRQASCTRSASSSRRGCRRCASPTASAGATAAPRPPRSAHFPIVRGSAIDGHGWSAGDTRKPIRFRKLSGTDPQDSNYRPNVRLNVIPGDSGLGNTSLSTEIDDGDTVHARHSRSCPSCKIWFREPASNRQSQPLRRKQTSASADRRDHGATGSSPSFSNPTRAQADCSTSCSLRRSSRALRSSFSTACNRSRRRMQNCSIPLNGGSRPSSPPNTWFACCPFGARCDTR